MWSELGLTQRIPSPVGFTRTLLVRGATHESDKSKRDHPVGKDHVAADVARAIASAPHFLTRSLAQLVL